MTPLLDSSSRPLFVLRRISDGFIIHQRAISNTIPPNLPNPGPDEQYLPIFTDEPPGNDPIYTLVDQSEGPDAPAPINATQWQIKYTVKDRPLDERLAIADNAKRFEVQKHVPLQDFTEMAVLTLAAVLRQAKGLELTPDERTKADQLVAVAAKLSANVVNAEDIKTAIESGQKPDLTTGWAAVEVSP